MNPGKGPNVLRFGERARDRWAKGEEKTDYVHVYDHDHVHVHIHVYDHVHVYDHNHEDVDVNVVVVGCASDGTTPC